VVFATLAAHIRILGTFQFEDEIVCNFLANPLSAAAGQIKSTRPVAAANEFRG